MKAVRPQRGFTLLEMSIVLAIIAIVIGMSAQMGVSVIATAKLTSTQRKMKALDDALMAFRTGNDRLPCPGDLTITQGTANYGVEAGAGTGSAIGVGTGVCTGTGMLPQANHTAAGATNTGATAAEGAVPTVTLGLPNDFMYDGWDNRFRYAVDISTTVPGAFSNLSLACSPGGAITVNDVNGVARSTGSIYALISHGPNGHGGYTKNGVMQSANSTSVDELTNCHCDHTATATTYAPTYVQKDPAYDAAYIGSALYYFDDLVSYKERWQMPTAWDKTTSAGCTDYLAIVQEGGNHDCPYLFSVSNGSVTNLGAPTTCAAWNWSGGTGDFTPNDKIFAWGGGMYNSSGDTTAGILYSVASTGLTYSSTNISAVEQVGALAISPNGNYMAVSGAVLSGSTSTTWSSYYLRLYTSSSTFSSAVSSIVPNDTLGYNQLAWSPDGNTLYAANGGNTPFMVDVYTLSGSTLTYSQTITNPYCWTYSIAVHPSGNYLAMSNTCPGHYPYVIASPLNSPTQISGGLVAPASGQAVDDVAWSPDGNFLGVANTDGTIQVYGFNSAGSGGVYFTPETISGTVCTTGSGAGQYVAFSSDSQYAAFTATNNSGGPQVCIYKRNNSTGTVWTNVYSGFPDDVTASLPVWSK